MEADSIAPSLPLFHIRVLNLQAEQRSFLPLPLSPPRCLRAVPEDVQAEPVCSPGAMPLLAGRGGGGDIAGLLPLQLGDCPQGDLQLREDPAGTLPRRQPDRGAAQSKSLIAGRLRN